MCGGDCTACASCNAQLTILDEIPMNENIFDAFGGTAPQTDASTARGGEQVGSWLKNPFGAVLDPVKNLASTTTTTTEKEATPAKDNTTTILVVVGAVMILAIAGFLMFKK